MEDVMKSRFRFVIDHDRNLEACHDLTIQAALRHDLSGLEKSFAKTIVAKFLGCISMRSPPTKRLGHTATTRAYRLREIKVLLPEPSAQHHREIAFLFRLLEKGRLINEENTPSAVERYLLRQFSELQPIIASEPDFEQLGHLPKGY